MCQDCVARGRVTKEDMDAAIAAGDRTWISYQDRIRQGEDANVLLDQLRPVAALLGYPDVAALIDASLKRQAAEKN